jgi:hypothetical protein
MKKQTAVEWLVANIDWQLLKNTSTHYEMIVNKAKEMEREQIIKAYETAMETDIYNEPLKIGNQYYTETFNP